VTRGNRCSQSHGEPKCADQRDVEHLAESARLIESRRGRLWKADAARQNGQGNVYAVSTPARSGRVRRRTKEKGLR